jgi:diguanylate cyclase (GGDEF)-like protein
LANEEHDSARPKSIVTTRSTSPVAAASADPVPAALVVLYGPHLGRRYPLPAAEGEGECVIGRVDDVAIPMDSDSVSRRHARVAPAKGGFVLEDLGSTNGTFVNDHKVNRVTLKDGDVVRIGAAMLKFLCGHNVEASYHEEIYRITILDGLTGVHNKRFLLEFLDREASRASRHLTPLALVMLDIDHFKKINETHGHLAGDAVLKDLCRRIRPRVRREDLFARYGGEEFACVLPDTNRVGAIAFAEKIRQLVEREPVRHEDLSLPITVSIGVTTTERAEQLEAIHLIRRADEKLYEAKRAGRNRVAG